MIEDLKKKLKGELPINRYELIRLIDSWGRNEESNFNGYKLEKCQSKECYDLSYLDVSQINDFSNLFKFSLYNGDLSKWDVSNSIQMNSMFEKSDFNNDSLKDWNVSKVTTMRSMFKESKFNGDISKWNVKNCMNIGSMFKESKFNGDISNWSFNKNLHSIDVFQNNKPFKDKYNNGKEILSDVFSFKNWFKSNREKMKEININNKIENNKNTLDSFLQERGIDKNSDLGKQLIEVYNEKQNKLKQDLENIENLKKEVSKLAELDFFNK